MRNAIVAYSVAVLLVLVALACGPGKVSAQDLPAAYHLSGLYIGFATEGLAKQDNGAWEKRYRICTTAPVVVDRDYMYGYMVEHCVDNRPDFIVQRYWVFNEAKDLVEAEVSDLLGNEIVSWRAANAWGLAPRRLAVSAKVSPEDQFVYYCGLWKTSQARKAICAAGQIMGAPAEYLSGTGDYYVGDLVFAGPVYWGFSGAPIFVAREGRYELVALANAFSVFSNIAFGLLVPEGDVVALWRGAKAQAPRKPVAISQPKGYNLWAAEYQRFWDEAYEANAFYSVSYANSQYSLSVFQGGSVGVFSFEDTLAVLVALVDGKLRLAGTLQGVKWEEFALEPVAIKDADDKTQGAPSISLGVPIKIEVTIPIDEKTQKVMYDSFAALHNLADSLNFYSRVQLIVLSVFALANAIVLGILLVTDSRVRRAANKAAMPFKRIAMRLRGA